MYRLKISETCQIKNLKDIYRKYFGFKKDGIFVEVGAYDGESYSNTSGLADIGWKGVYVEPVEDFAKKCLVRHCQNNVKVENVAVNSSYINQEVEINVGDAVSTLLAKHADLYKKLPWSKDIVFRKSKCKTKRLDSIFFENNINQYFDLLVVDVEGMEEDVFNSFGLNYWLPKMIIVELVDNNNWFNSSPETVESCKKLRNEIEKSGYVSVYQDEINTVFVHYNHPVLNPKKGYLDLNILPSLLKSEAPMIFDIGANDGMHTKLFYDIFNNASIHSFEPDPRAINKFKKNLHEYPQYVLHEFALSDRNGEVDFYQSSGEHEGINDWDKSGSIKRPTGHIKVHPKIQFNDPCKIVAKTLDSWRLENSINTIDLIWADVQGGEEELIVGGINTFTDKVRYFYTEYSNEEMYENGINLDQILTLLPSYEIVELFEGDVLLRNVNTYY